MAYSVCKIKNISGEIKQLHEKEFAIDEIFTIADEKRQGWANNDDVLKAIAEGIFEIHDEVSVISGIAEQIKWLQLHFPKEVQPISDLTCEWACIKNFYNSNTPACTMHYFEKPDRYYIWIEYREQKFYLPNLMKNTSDCTDFETNFKSKCNIHEATKVRITTCKVGRKLHDRYISFTTADQNCFDNTDFNNDSYGDITYKMYKWVNDERVLTTNNLEADETWIEFEPAWDYEISRGAIDIPSTLAGLNDNAWEIHVIAVPDIAKQYGGTIELIANPRLKFRKGKTVQTDSSMHPAEMLYNATYHTNKIRFIIMHPQAAQSEFQINLKLYK